MKKMALVRLFFWLHLPAWIIVPFFRDWGRLSFTQILLIQAWFMVWNFLLEVPTGVVADHLGRRISIASAGVLMDQSLPLAFATFGIVGISAAIWGASPRKAIEG